MDSNLKIGMRVRVKPNNKTAIVVSDPNITQQMHD